MIKNPVALKSSKESFQHSDYAGNGMTLVELLLSLAIAVILISIVFSVYGTVIAATRAQFERRNFRAPAAAALEWMARDMSRAFAPIGSTNPPFVVDMRTNGPGREFLRLATAEPDGAGEPQFYDSFAVRYLFDKKSNDEADGYVLARESRRLENGAAEQQDDLEYNVLASKIGRLEIEVFNGDNWTNEWGVHSDDGMPLAAKIRIEAHGESGLVLESEIIIPAGHSIKRETGLNDLR